MNKRKNIKAYHSRINNKFEFFQALTFTVKCMWINEI